VIAYFDTSALLKLLLTEEAGAGVAAGIWNGADGLVTSRLAYPEGRAALAAARRGRRMTRARHQVACATLEEIFNEVETVDLVPAIARAAGDLAERLSLKGADAVHLASALDATKGGETVLVTWDRSLGRAGLVAGLAVAPS